MGYFLSAFMTRWREEKKKATKSIKSRLPSGSCWKTCFLHFFICIFLFLFAFLWNLFGGHWRPRCVEISILEAEGRGLLGLCTLFWGIAIDPGSLNMSFTECYFHFEGGNSEIQFAYRIIEWLCLNIAWYSLYCSLSPLDKRITNGPLVQRGIEGKICVEIKSWRGQIPLDTSLWLIMVSEKHWSFGRLRNLSALFFYSSLLFAWRRSFSPQTRWV